MPKSNNAAKEVEKLKESYNIQRTTLDKIWFYILTSGKIGITEGSYFTADETEEYESLLKTNPKGAEELYGKVHQAYGLKKDLHKSDELDKFEDDLNKHIYSTFVDDESSKSVYKGLDNLAIIELKTLIQVGKELDEMLKRFKEDDPLRMQKAMYVLGLSQSYGTQLEYGVSNFKTTVCMQFPEWTTEQSDYLKHKTSTLSGCLSEEDRKYYRLGVAARDGSHPTSTREMAKWVEEEGIKMGEELRKKNIAGVLDRIDKELSTGTPYRIADDKNLAEAIETSKRDVDDTFLRGVISDLESTKTGEKHWYQLGWHSDNSPKYKKMLDTLKLYEYYVSAGEMAKSITLREKLISATLAYIGDKVSSVRDTEFGKKRFDDSLMLLSEIMPSRRFKKVISAINKRRDTRPGKEDYIDIEYYSPKNSFREDNLHNKLHLIGREIEDKKQEEAKSNRINMPKEFLKNFTKIEETFGIEAMKFPKEESEFVPIGGYLHNEHLDNKDFAALSYITNVGKMEDNAKLHGSALNSKKLDDIKASGEEVAAALKEYSKGNKEPLADIIRNGVNNITKECANAKYIDGTYVINAEMGRRVKGMIDRDPELYTIAAKKGMTIGDISKLTPIIHCATTFSRGVAGITKVIDAEKGNGKITKNEKLEIYTDLIMKRVIDESIVLKDEGKIKSTLLPNIEDKHDYKALRNEVKAFVVKNGVYKLNSTELKKQMQATGFGIKVKGFVSERVNRPVEAAKTNKQTVKKGKATEKVKTSGMNK